MPDYTLYYWPIPFRGHFIRYAISYAEATWDEPSGEAVATLKNQPPEHQPYPFMAPPLLVDHGTGRTISQMPAILMHLAGKHRLSADPVNDLRLICDASDILFEITRSHGQLMWDAESWSEFAGSRLPRWMRIHERIATDGGVTRRNGFLRGGNGPGLGDLVLAALWHTMIDRMPPLRALLNRHAPALEGLVDRVAAEPPIAALRAEWEDRAPVYCAGQIEASLLKVLGMENLE